MISKFELSDYIAPTEAEEDGGWLDLADPDEKELNAVADQYQLPRWFLADPLDPKERPRIALAGRSLLIVVRLPVEDQRSDGPFFHTVPVGVVITTDLVLTVCRRKDLVTDQMSSLFQRKRKWTNVRLAFTLFQKAGTTFINKLERLEDLAGEAEARLRRAPENDSLLALLNIEKSLIDLTLALKSNHALMDKFHQPDPFGLNLGQVEKDILDDAITENQQAIFMAEIFSQILASMSDAFGSIISNNLNKIMKFMTAVTIVLMIPTIIAGLYGMNVNLPLAETPAAFWVLFGFGLSLMGVVSFLFAKKKWF